ncbi:MAG: methylated-DNA--[protein]-cysteine S-methyltransferase [Dehalococcoidia bacterium]|nr:MAG: methylated-DNA--[protein]-cysteine S-methyltransferase [Dehalococcoidia bacterium]
MGWVGILGSAKGLLRTTLPQHSAQEAHQLLGNGANYAIWSPNLFHGLMERFKSYFGGNKIAFPDELDLSEATPFQRKVWETTRLIPYGETKSYTWVAQQVGKPQAARAVGQALARNRLPIIIPCHRVLTINGQFGGFTGGVEMKRRLLYLEASASAN